MRLQRFARQLRPTGREREGLPLEIQQEALAERLDLKESGAEGSRTLDLCIANILRQQCFSRITALRASP